MLCGMRERGIVPDLILFADTKGEKPETYAHMKIMDGFTRLWWNQPILTVRKLYRGEHEGLEGNCLRKNMLPSLAYGKKACSQKYKIEPQNQYLKKWLDEKGIHQAIKAIGYHAKEGHRAVKKSSEDLRKGRVVTFWYPLIEWQWTDDDCVTAIRRAGIPVPGKSACFFCPSSKRSEVFQLRDESPALLARALAMEDAAQPGLTTHRGLGGAKNRWRDWLHNDAAQDYLDLEPVHAPCGCFD